MWRRLARITNDELEKLTLNFQDAQIVTRLL